jgi:hypothetical protein
MALPRKTSEVVFSHLEKVVADDRVTITIFEGMK